MDLLNLIRHVPPKFSTPLPTRRSLGCLLESLLAPLKHRHHLRSGRVWFMLEVYVLLTGRFSLRLASDWLEVTGARDRYTLAGAAVNPLSARQRGAERGGGGGESPKEHSFREKEMRKTKGWILWWNNEFRAIIGIVDLRHSAGKLPTAPVPGRRFSLEQREAPLPVCHANIVQSELGKQGSMQSGGD